MDLLSLIILGVLMWAVNTYIPTAHSGGEVI